jgi:hypothetical protein
MKVRAHGSFNFRIDGSCCVIIEVNKVVHFLLMRRYDLGFGVWDLGFGVWGLGFGIWNLEFFKPLKHIEH